MKRLRLKDWLKLSDIHKKLSNNQDIPDNILAALALGGDKDYRRLPWFEVGEAFFTLGNANRITIEFPVLKGSKGKQSDPVPWDYPERDWYYWVHLLAGQYSWSMEYIAEMDVDDAIALMQEIELDRQLEREWEYQISEVAYPYDPASKKQRFKPLNRPGWMMAGVLTMKPKKRKMLRSLVPQGNVIKVNADKDADTS